MLSRTEANGLTSVIAMAQLAGQLPTDRASELIDIVVREHAAPADPNLAEIARLQKRIHELEFAAANPVMVTSVDSWAGTIAVAGGVGAYRKKPVVIVALRWDGTDACREVFAAWFDAHDYLFMTRGDLIEIDTLEGKMAANVGDWVICGVKGEFYPCKPDIFAATYEAVKP